MSLNHLFEPKQTESVSSACISILSMDQSILFCNGLFILAWNSPAFIAPGSTFRISSPQPKLNYAHTLIDSLRLTRPGFRANLSLQLALDLHGVSLSHTSCYTHMRPPKSPPQQDISNVHLNRSLTKSTRTSVFFFFFFTDLSWQIQYKVIMTSPLQSTP